MPVPLAPNFPSLAFPVSFVASLRPDMPVALKNGGFLGKYREEIETNATVLERTEDSDAVVVKSGKTTYVGAWLDQDALQRVVKNTCNAAGVSTQQLPDGVRIRETLTERFVFNHNAHSITFDGNEIAAANLMRQLI